MTAGMYPACCSRLPYMQDTAGVTRPSSQCKTFLLCRGMRRRRLVVLTMTQVTLQARCRRLAPYTTGVPPSRIWRLINPKMRVGCSTAYKHELLGRAAHIHLVYSLR